MESFFSISAVNNRKKTLIYIRLPWGMKKNWWIKMLNIDMMTKKKIDSISVYDSYPTGCCLGMRDVFFYSGNFFSGKKIPSTGLFHFIHKHDRVIHSFLSYICVCVCVHFSIICWILMMMMMMIKIDEGSIHFNLQFFFHSFIHSNLTFLFHSIEFIIRMN